MLQTATIRGQAFHQWTPSKGTSRYVVETSKFVHRLPSASMLLSFSPFGLSLRSQICNTASPRKIISFLVSSTIRSWIIYHLSLSLPPAARRYTFHAVFSLSRVVPATDSCVTLAIKSYRVEISGGGLSTYSLKSRPRRGKLTIVGFFSSTKTFLVNRLQ